MAVDSEYHAAAVECGEWHQIFVVDRNATQGGMCGRSHRFIAVLACFGYKASALDTAFRVETDHE